MLSIGSKNMSIADRGAPKGNPLKVARGLL
jgi:hypothetical protein